MTSNRLSPVRLAILSALLAACGSDNTTEPGPQPVPVANVEVTPATHTLVALGATQQFQAVAKDANGATVSGKTFTWTSLDTMVATVSASGLVTAVRNGTATVRATTDGISGDASVTVSQQQTALVMRTQPDGAAAGTPFTTQPVVEVHDARGNVATNDDATEVTVTLGSGGGTLTGTMSATAVAGIATFTDLAIGGTVGDRTLAFAAQDLAGVTSASFTLGPGPAAQLVLTAGNNQTALAATALPEPFSVKVADAFDNGVPIVTVAWAVTSGSGILSAATSSTNSGGVATVTYTLGRYEAVETVTASVTDLAGSPITFSATATPNGTISGTITLTNALLTPPAPMVASRDIIRVGPTRALVRPQEGEAKVQLSARTAERPPRVVPPSAPEYVPSELIVTFRPGPLSAPPVGSSRLASASSAAVVARSIRQELAHHVAPGWLSVHGVSPAILAARVKVSDAADLNAVAAQLRADPGVATVERNPIVRLDATARRTDYLAAVTPDDPFYPLQAWHYAMIDAPEAWQVTTGNAAVLVAVVDDGIRFDHPGIAANLTTDGYDFVANSSLVSVCGVGLVGRAGDGDEFDADPTNPFDGVFNAGLGCYDPNPSGNHGLHVAGTIGAAGSNGDGGAGVNWTVAIRPIRVFGIDGSGSNYEIAQGILYAAGLPADDGAGGTVQAASAARVINLSLGGPASSTVLEDAVIAATNAGASLIAAAGNSATADPNYPAAYPQTISVSAVGPDAVIASYSSFGSTVDIAAPGGDDVIIDITSAIWSTAWDYSASAPIWAGFPWVGTSMAAPHVSGVAALLLAQEPALTAAELRGRLLNYAMDIGTAGPDDFYGYGLVNARNALTQSLSPTRQLFAQLFDATTGEVVQTTAAQADGSYAFTEMPDGDYVVFAGQDTEGDGIVGVPTRRWGAFGGSATPTVLTVDGAGTYDATFSAGVPIEVEPNDDFATVQDLPMDGYLIGTTGTALGDADVSKVRVPSRAQYTFETAAVDGACGLALEEDTVLQLYNGAGTLLLENDNVDAAEFDYCSRITTSLNAGTYFVAVWGRLGHRRYTVLARSGT